MSLDTLQTTWFILIAVLWAGFFMLEGFDFGVGIVTPFVGRDDEERRTLKETTGPFWDGNEVWLIVAVAATFAAFPDWYATMFSAYYLPLFVVVLALILRATGTDYRDRREGVRWRRRWDRIIAGTCLLIPFLLGVMFGGLLVGIPISSKMEFTGDLTDLVHPFALMSGVFLVALCVFQGLLFLRLKTSGDLRARVSHRARWAGLVVVVLAVVHTVWQQVEADRGAIPGAAAWLALTFLVAAAVVALEHEHAGWAFLCSALGIVFTIVDIFAALYPNTMVSSTSTAYNLTVSDSSNSYTLSLMTIIAALILPVVLLYTGWSYWVFRGRMKRSPELESDGSRVDAG
jgi:cytochrome d ubiquinol oxidase subunit II